MFCHQCSKKDSPTWHRKSNKEFICHACYLQDQWEMKEQEFFKKVGTKATSRTTLIANQDSKVYFTRFALLRRKVVAKKSLPALAKRTVNSKGRRTIFKLKKPVKGIEQRAEDRTMSTMTFMGQLYQAGDIISVVDATDKRLYYAQCRRFMIDRSYHKLVSYQWLLPSKHLVEGERFIPSKFCLGPEDDVFHDMASVQFVCNAPLDYYYPQKGFSQGSKRNTISIHV